MLLDMDKNKNINFIASFSIGHIWLSDTEVKGEVPPPSLANTPLVLIGMMVGKC